MNNSNCYTLCPVCGKHKFSDRGDQGNVCKHCGWIHDSVSEENNDIAIGPNELSLDNFKLRYLHYIDQNPKYHWAHDLFPEIPQIEKMICPVCEKFVFEPLTWYEILAGEKPEDSFCMKCGWYYDIEQRDNPTKTNGTNSLSLKEFKREYEAKLAVNIDYDYFDEITKSYIPIAHSCPVCNKYMFKDRCCFDVCPFCGWEDDGTDDDTDNIGANDLKYSDFKFRYQKYVEKNPEYKWKKNGFV